MKYCIPKYVFVSIPLHQTVVGCVAVSIYLYSFVLCAMSEEQRDDSMLLPVCSGEGDRWGFIDINGEQVVKPKYEQVYAFWKEERFYPDYSRWVACIEDDWYTISVDGRQEAMPMFKGATYVLHRGGSIFLEIRHDGSDASDDSQWRVCHMERGELANMSSAGLLSEGLFPFRDIRTGTWGYADRNGVVAIPASFADAQEFREGLAAVQEGPRLWAYIDRQSRTIITPIRAVVAHEFRCGLARIHLLP